MAKIYLCKDTQLSFQPRVDCAFKNLESVNTVKDSDQEMIHKYIHKKFNNRKKGVQRLLENRGSLDQRIEPTHGISKKTDLEKK